MPAYAEHDSVPFTVTNGDLVDDGYVYGYGNSKCLINAVLDAESLVIEYAFAHADCHEDEQQHGLHDGDGVDDRDELGNGVRDGEPQSDEHEDGVSDGDGDVIAEQHCVVECLADVVTDGHRECDGVGAVDSVGDGELVGHRVRHSVANAVGYIEHVGDGVRYTVFVVDSDSVAVGVSFPVTERHSDADGVGVLLEPADGVGDGLFDGVDLGDVERCCDGDGFALDDWHDVGHGDVFLVGDGERHSVGDNEQGAPAVVVADAVTQSHTNGQRDGERDSHPVTRSHALAHEDGNEDSVAVEHDDGDCHSDAVVFIDVVAIADDVLDDISEPNGDGE